jgi:hypothetical protein
MHLAEKSFSFKKTQAFVLARLICSEAVSNTDAIELLNLIQRPLTARAR